MPLGDSLRRFTLVIIMVYIGLAVGAFVWISLRNDGTWPWSHSPGDFMEPGWAALIGTVSGYLVALLSQLSVNRFSWARRLEEEFATILGCMSDLEVLLIAIFSSVAEEALFRGAMQPLMGLMLTSIVFGLLHSGPKQVFLPWTGMAIAMGFVLGGLFIWTGSLLAPILCHGVINALNLRRIALRARQLQKRTRTI